MKEKAIQVRKVALLLVLMFFSLSLYAQVTVSGTVTDETGNTLPGVNVFEKNTTNGTITDLDGKYSLKVQNGATVSFSFIGYDEQEFVISSTKNINVVLKESSKEIEEVVVVGYGQQRKASVVGAITQTTGKTLERAAGVADLSNALTGNLPGVVTVQSTGMPGEEEAQITIRGESSWNGSTPLVLVDGIERPMSSVDVSSVQSISVLKDASATAVYGVKGANGVILITTKRGSEGKAQINVSVTSTLKTVSKLPGKYDSYDAWMYRNLAVEHELNLLPENFNLIRTQQHIDHYRYREEGEKDEYGNLMTERYPNVDWQDEIFKHHAMAYNASLNVSGGNKFVRYFSAVDWANEGDMMKVFDNGRGYKGGYAYNRFNVRSNLDFSLTKTTVFKVNLAGSLGVRKTPWNNGNAGVGDWGISRQWAGVYEIAPDIFLPKYADGSWGYDYLARPNATNSAESVSIGGVQYTTNTKITTDFILEQKLDMLTKGLSAKASISWDNNFTEWQRGVSDMYNDPQHKWIDPETGDVHYQREKDNQTGLDPDANPIKWSPNGGAVQDWATGRNLTYLAQLNWDRNFGKHFITAMGLFQRQENATGSEIPHYREDWVFRVTYNWNDRYFCEYNGAYNGSEKFSSDNRFAFFNSGALGWMISNEPFMANLKDKGIIDQLKLRASYGEIGDDNVWARWLYMTEWSMGSSGGGNSVVSKVPMSSDRTSSPYQIYRESKVGNPDVHWEVVRKFNVGIDYSFLNGLFSGSLEYFKDKRSDMLVRGGDRAVPAWFGQEAATANLGKVENKGYELELKINKTFENKIRAWGNFSMTHSESLIKVKDDAQLLPEYRKQAGYAIGQTRTYLNDGRLTTYDELYAAPQTFQFNDQRLFGDYYFIDFNADGKITEDDRAPWGYSGTPQNTYNATLGIEYKGWSAFAQFYGVTNVLREVGLTSFSGKYVNVYEQGNWYSENQQEADIATPRYNSSMFDTGKQFWYDASYIRLKTVEIAYTFPKLMLGKYSFTNVKIYLNGNNLWLWSRMPDDRESNFAGASYQGQYPTVKRFTIGLRFSL